MKKIFLIPLLTLLCTVMAWGNVVQVNVNSEEGMRSALKEANSQDSTEITLTGDINFKATSFVVPKNAHVLLNLNGHGITSSYNKNGDAQIYEDAVFDIRGLLHIISTGKGIVQKPTGGEGGAGVLVPNGGTLIVDGGIFVGGYGVMKELSEPGFEFRVKLPVVWCNNPSNVIINGGTFLTTPVYCHMNNWGVIMGNSTFTIRGGIFSTNVSDYLTTEYINPQVPYKNANIPGYTSNKNVYVVVPTTGDRLIVDANSTISADATKSFVYVEPGMELTIADGAKLHVGEAGIVLGGTDSKLIIDAGATLISDGDIITSADENLELTMDVPNGKFSNLLIKKNNIQEKHPNATVVMKSKAYQKENGAYVYQRFAVPSYLSDIKRKNGLAGFSYIVPTAVYKWDYSAAVDDWTVIMPTSEEAFEPFQCYDMTNSATSAGSEYTFKCELVGNGTPELPLRGAWNYYANSYTAPIDVAAMVTDLASYDHIRNSVWVHNMSGKGWNVISELDVEDGPIDVEKIEPMQAFVYRWNEQSVATNPELKYDTYVYNPLVGTSAANNAPARRAARNYTRATISVADANGEYNTMKLFEGEDFSASVDNNYSVEKLMNEDCFNMYFAAQEGNFAYVASEKLANMAITLETKEATSYTVNVKNADLEGYVLRDNLTGTETELVSGNTYSFSAPANSTIEGRFEIVAVAQMPTAIDDVEVNANVKGIYTLTGQYLGENFHALPAGVYVVNGKKVVK
jgi:hypothetical protein